ncbi:alkanesulfonate monooxygenase SsuD/methylene tetrahydromethanopterin reductase-like flavin-dependent oxidoreductase (luciferase family) [Amycolatopsis sulphurea]|uniref:Alkanesulfonate monooxygenase SsuD/methylene tetrahydromethanopterin reductase-like flavin-dependent oxidoreductase (Luciferase family) n=1 Tax=Amycolatopsis sulphurea TaxID=76022 RepID=A0A2A9G3I0_9PSEU|nr:LLM class flavin-dependent oxidoreductase [Amycolatopsis sulphurea]PFG57350.1 alkanesulfonate monooxygenase SsuD/methylene tetrahydromethanopterin reductase-like flavin-dependent oxidoreductase (luciferase family) [Amycolatopsis sulphurea]
MTAVTGPRLAVALDGAGWHPAAWREPDARPSDLFTAGYWADLVRQAEAAHLDFVTFEDFLSLRSPSATGVRTDLVQPRLDAVLIASRVAPLTSHIGLIPTAVVTHTEPFHLSKAIATLDYVSTGRAGVRAQVSGSLEEFRHFGRRTPGSTEDLFDEAADYLEVLRRLWDSWEDGAEIRDVATGRFVDRDKLHYIDFEGRWFSVKGPSITPRPPQGQPPVAALAHNPVAYRLAARQADLVYVTPSDRTHSESIVAEVRAAESGRHLQIFADLVVFLDETTQAAVDRKARLDSLAEFTSDAHVFTGTPAALADLLLDWQTSGLSGFRLRPGTLPHDLTAITDGLVPELRRRGAFRTGYEAGTLRGLLGLPRPAARYAA